VTKLVRNYRSHPALLKLPNDLYYDGELQNCGDVFVTHSLCRWEHLPKAGFPLLFHSITGRNLREGNSPSWFNPEEAQQVAAYVDLLIRESRPPTAYEDIGIITPYARQAQKIRAALQISHPGNSIKVGSVETFQGQERRVIILSTVRSDPDLFFDHDAKYNLGFVAHPKRFNVAMTRAKALMIVVGCPSVLDLDRDNWLPLLMYCHEQNAWAGDEWEPSSAQEGDGEAGDEIAVMRNESAHKLNQESWDVVQVEEIFGYVHREE
jgi:helicase MOV-10